MDKMKQWVTFTLVGVLVIAAAGWFLLISPKKDEAQAVRDESAGVLSANAQLVTKLAMLKEQAKDLPQQQARLAKVAAKIPDNPALPALVRALSDAAEESGVELVSIAPAPPVEYKSAGAAAPTTAAGTAPAAAGSTAATAVVASSLQSIPVAINVVGSYFQVEQFLDELESLTRALKVTAFALAPGESPVKPVAAGSSAPALAASETGRSLQATITSQVFMTSAAQAVATTATAK